jgi:hypothetical protein
MDFPPAPPTRLLQVVGILVGLTAVLAAALSLLALDAHRKESRSSALEARVSSLLGQSVLHSELGPLFQKSVLYDIKELQDEGSILRGLGSSGYQRQVAKAEAAAAHDLRSTEAPAIGLPQGAPGKVAVAHQSATALKALRNYQDQLNALADRHERLARRGTRSDLALSLTAIAGTLLGLAGVLRAGRGGWLTLGVGAATLVAAAGVGAWALAA